MPKVVVEGATPSLVDLADERLRRTKWGVLGWSGDFGTVYRIRDRVLGFPLGKIRAVIHSNLGLNNCEFEVYSGGSSLMEALKKIAEEFEKRYSCEVSIILRPDE